jgi:hypothetical protein
VCEAMLLARRDEPSCPRQPIPKAKKGDTSTHKLNPPTAHNHALATHHRSPTHHETDSSRGTPQRAITKDER